MPAYVNISNKKKKNTDRLLVRKKKTLDIVATTPVE